MSNKSGVSSEAVVLPNGGGALQGIGESFTPNPFTGTGNFTVPIELPPGRNGFQPRLSLSYSTGEGSSPFGLGWSLNVSEISRKTLKGVPRYVEPALGANETDVFILSGDEDLAPVSESVQGTTRFRPRTEGIFALIEHNQSGGSDTWQVRSKDGLVSDYGGAGAGGNDPAVVADPMHRSKIFCWKLRQTTDSFGNRIEYGYHRDSKIDGPHVWDALYLETIRYVDYEKDGSTRFLVSVTFHYEERPDPFSDYRAGFEVRTRLRCKKIEIRTHAEQERLVRTIGLAYVDERVKNQELPKESLPPNGVSLLSQVQVMGHDGNQVEQMPPLEFGYTRFEPGEQRFKPFEVVNDLRPPLSLADDSIEIVGLFGNGLPDIIQMNGTARFWRNLGNGLFAAPVQMDEVPVDVHLHDAGVQLADMNGNGRADLLALHRGGYFPLTFEGRWSSQGFVAYEQAPLVSFGEQELRLVDVDGDGVIDALRTGDRFELFINTNPKGWDRVEEVQRGPIEGFPDLRFSDPHVKLADINGDNLQDFVLVTQGEISYWPYLGHGQWGKRIRMDNSPIFNDPQPLPEGFDPKRVQFGDLDGDGLDDIFYLEGRRLTFWINQGGNRWSAPIIVDNTPPLTDVDAVRLVDMLGTGMAGVLWTFDSTATAGSNMQFLDLNGGVKPYLLSEMDNHMGAITRVGYVPSTKFYLADQDSWITPLPFPVQLVERVESVDKLSGGKKTTQYTYHHGYWDGAEREFRGFGRVDQLDTEEFDSYNSPGLHGAATEFQSVAQRSYSPPLLTRTWFHSGPIGDESSTRVEPDFAAKNWGYWKGDPSILQRPADTEKLLTDLPASKHGDAFRSLRGQVLRTELYARDGSDQENSPFTVTEFQYGITEVDPPADQGDHRQRIFFPHMVAQRTTQWERGNEPMTQFTFTDNYDEFGQPQRQVSLAVPRGRNYHLAAPAGKPYLGTMIATLYAQPDDGERYIMDRVAATTTFEIVNDGSQAVLDLYRQVQGPAPDTKLIGQTFNYYDGEAFVGLPFRHVGNFGALVRSETLVMTEEILRSAYRDPQNNNSPAIPPYLRTDGAVSLPPEYPEEFNTSMPNLAGYTFADGTDHRERGYFAQSMRAAFDFQRPNLAFHRGLPVAMRDSFGHDTDTIYEAPYQVLPIEVTDPVGLTTRAKNDYRVLKPSEVTDANGNRRKVTFSPLGLVASTFIMGKNDEQVGDVGAPGSLLEYDFLAFLQRGQPISVRTVVREHHATESDVPLPQRDVTIEIRQFSDGFGRLLQTRTQAEDILFGDAQMDAALFGSGVLPLQQNDSTATLAAVIGRQSKPSDPRNVVVSGWQFYDNKGRIVEKFEPFFSKGFAYLSPKDEHTQFSRDVFGRKITIYYDARGRSTRTVNPDGSEMQVVYGMPKDIEKPDQFAPVPWEVYTYDANDLAPLCVGPDGASLADAAPRTHHFTPDSIEIDALGRTVSAVARHRDSQSAPNAPLPPIQELRTQTTYDIRGNVLTVTDALGRKDAFRYTYDLANRPLRIDSKDAGLRRIVLNVVGNEVERRDSKGALTLHAYDQLQRPIRLWARDNADADSRITLRQRMEYGDAGDPEQPTTERLAMKSLNLLGELHRHHDEAGLMTITRVDFKGNVLDKSRHVIADAPILAIFANGSANSWKITPFQVDWEPGPQGTLAELESELLETTPYQTIASYDALNRIKLLQLPRDVENLRRELRPEYNRAGDLERVQLDGEVFVERIARDAAGRRTLVAYGNGVMTRYGYDPNTLRLKRLRSEHFSKPNDLTCLPNGSVLQDFAYSYDLAGNILDITDRTPESGIRNNAEAAIVADPILATMVAKGDALIRRFEYDAIYRLRSATGRECDLPPGQAPFDSRPRCTDITRTRAYREQYQYDQMGNILRLRHSPENGGFTREFTIEPANNRLQTMEVMGDRFVYMYDGNGNTVSEATARHFEWNYADEMKAFRTQTPNAEPSIHAHYLYDMVGQRVKKLVRRQGGQVEVTHYIDGTFEHHRWGSGAQAGENNHVHIMDDKQRIAIVRLGANHPDDTGPAVQYHLGDHLGSSNVVLDANAALINREEFTPYGETSFGSFARKRYRFIGVEQDEESGMTYHAARYFSPWLARWLSTDPIGPKDDVNVYAYVANNPIRFLDGMGQAKDDPQRTDDEQSYEQPEIGYDVTGPTSYETGERPTGWAHARCDDDSSVEASGILGNPLDGFKRIKMQDGIGAIDLSIDIDDYRDDGWIYDTTHNPTGVLHILFTQRTGGGPITKMQSRLDNFSSDGGGALQVDVSYLPGGYKPNPVNGRREAYHTIVVEFTYSSDTSRSSTVSSSVSRENALEVGVSKAKGGQKEVAGKTESQTVNTKDQPVKWSTEIHFKSYDVRPSLPVFNGNNARMSNR